MNVHSRALDTTSSDSDIEERVRTKATRFFKAYPKVFSSKPQLSSSEANWSDRSDTGETNTTNLSTEMVKSKIEPQRMVRSPRKNTSIHKKVTNRNLLIPNIDLSSESDEDDRNNNTSQCHLVQEVESYKTTRENLKHLKTGSNCIDILSTSNSNKSSSETDNLSEDHSAEKLNAVMPSTSCIGTKTTTLVKPRPFKSYPEDPLAVAIGFDTARMAINRGKPENYDDFRRKMICKRGTNKSDVNSNMRRFYASEISDSLYKEKRKKNNLAAKRSRDARRAKEDELAVRCAYLEQENMFLKKKLSEFEQQKGK